MDNICDRMAYSLIWEDAMKRDMDLARKILLKIEESDDPESMDLSIEGYTAKQINYNLELLHEAGLIKAKSVGGTGSSEDTIDWMIFGLTWNGHEFVEAAKDNTRWEQAKKTVIGKVGSYVFDSLLQSLLALARAQLGL
jgi:hypothetical protein